MSLFEAILSHDGIRLYCFDVWMNEEREQVASKYLCNAIVLITALEKNTFAYSDLKSIRMTQNDHI